MILYVNGDSHSAGAEAVNDYCFAEDDPLYWSLGRLPHPDNERVSYGCLLANKLNALLYCDAESASSNDRIIRTTREYFKDNKPDIIVIGWSTWERQEWLYEGRYWQVNAGGIGHDWPNYVKEKYKNYVLDLDWDIVTQAAHHKIYEFHLELESLQIPHLFFNTFNYFKNCKSLDWKNSFISPYDSNMTYYNWLAQNGYKSKPSYHYGPEAHAKWAEFLFPYLTRIM